MNGKKRGGAKTVSLSRRKAQPDAFEKLSDNPTPSELKSAAVNVALAELEDRVADVRESWETDSLFEDAFEELTANSDVVVGRKLPLTTLPRHGSNLANSTRRP